MPQFAVEMKVRVVKRLSEAKNLLDQYRKNRGTGPKAFDLVWKSYCMVEMAIALAKYSSPEDFSSIGQVRKVRFSAQKDLSLMSEEVIELELSKILEKLSEAEKLLSAPRPEMRSVVEYCRQARDGLKVLVGSYSEGRFNRYRPRKASS